MIKETVYLDTTIPSFYFDERESFKNWIEETQRWWQEESFRYELWISDATHLAYASYYGIDYLLTWNCNHLANARKKKHITIINGRLGLSTPEIVTPLNLVEEKNENR